MTDKPAATGSGEPRREGHSALRGNNGKLETFDPHPTPPANQPTVTLALWESREKFKQIHAYLNATTPDIEQAKALCKSGRAMIDTAMKAEKRDV